MAKKKLEFVKKILIAGRNFEEDDGYKSREIFLKQATVTTKGMESQKKSKSEKRSSLASNGKVNAAFWYQRVGVSQKKRFNKNHF